MTKVEIIVPGNTLIKFTEHLDKYANDSSEEIRDIAKDLCPVDSGALRNSIEIDKHGDVINIGSILDYSDDIEYGNLKISPQPFLRPALIRVKSQQ